MALPISAPPPGLDEFLAEPQGGEQIAPAQTTPVPAGLDAFIAPELQEEVYSTPGQQIATGIEGAASAATFGLSTGLERALGVKPEDIQARREVNPEAHMAGQAAGLIGSSFIPGVGAANLLTKAGAATAKAVGLGAAQSMAARIGSAAVQGAVENAVFQGGDEVAKMLAGNPNQSVETAISDIGLSAVLGGGLTGGITGGAEGAKALWKATGGVKVGGILKSLTDKLGGKDGELMPDEIHNALQATGIDAAPEVKAALSNDPAVRQMFQTLQESSSSSGIAAQKAVQDFRTQAADSILASVGKTPEEVSNLSALSEYDAGNEVKAQLAADLKAQIDPISKQFDKVRERFKSVEIDMPKRVELAEAIGKINNEKGYSLSASSPGAKIINDVISELPNIKTLEDLRKYQSIVSEKAADRQLWALGKDLRGVFREAEDAILDDNLARSLSNTGKDAVRDPFAVVDARQAAVDAAQNDLQIHSQARQSYRQAMQTIEELNDRLHVGKYSGPGSFVKALEEMSPEDLLRRLSPKGDVGIINELSSKFPSVSQKVREYYLNQILKSAASKAGPSESINTKVLFNALDKMSPEMRSFLVPDMTKIEAIKSVMDALPGKMNSSGTARTLDNLWKHMPGSAIAAIGMLTGHNPLVSGAIGAISGAIGRNVPDAVRLGMLKFLGSNQPIEAQGFKAMVEMIDSTIKGENRLNSSAKAVFKAGQAVLPESAIPSDKDRERLDKQLKALQKIPEGLTGMHNDAAYYLPDHGTALSATTANAVAFINSQRPNTSKQSPLDSDPPVSPAQKAQFDRILNIAQQPLVVLSRIQAGTVVPQDINAMKAMYPALYERLVDKLTANLINTVNKGEIIPYKTRFGLSLFLGQPLDSTMTPRSIIAAQPSQEAQAKRQMSSDMPHATTQSASSALNKMSKGNQTSLQAREQRALK